MRVSRICPRKPYYRKNMSVKNLSEETILKEEYESVKNLSEETILKEECENVKNLSEETLLREEYEIVENICSRKLYSWKNNNRMSIICPRKI